MQSDSLVETHNPSPLQSEGLFEEIGHLIVLLLEARWTHAVSSISYASQSAPGANEENVIQHPTAAYSVWCTAFNCKNLGDLGVPS